MTSTCYRCHQDLDDRGTKPEFVLYLGSDKSSDRVNVHAVCIADEVADGRLSRVSPFAFVCVAPEEYQP